MTAIQTRAHGEWDMGARRVSISLPHSFFLFLHFPSALVKPYSLLAVSFSINSSAILSGCNSIDQIYACWPMAMSLLHGNRSESKQTND
jgi:hypothetical protein